MNNFCHFTLLKTKVVPADCAEKNRLQVGVLREEFERSFSNLKRIKPEFNLLTFPFTINVNSAPKNIQMEVIDLQTDSSLKESF